MREIMEKDETFTLKQNKVIVHKIFPYCQSAAL